MAASVRTELLKLVLVGVAALGLPAHSPYAQWYAYRAKHVVIVAEESRLEAATAVAALVAASWPESKAVAGAARSGREVVSLLRSGQLQVGLLSTADALSGASTVPLRALGVVRGQIVVVLASYPAEKALRISRALGAVPVTAPIPLHAALGS